MKIPYFAAAGVLLMGTAFCQAQEQMKISDAPLASQAVTLDPRAKDERLSFQTFDPWSPRTNLDADVAIVYGIDATIPDRIKTWRERGYIPQVMTGVAWGEYQDYLFGKWDGKNHEDESQTDRDGKIVGHGVNVPYMSPSASYGHYLSDGVKRAIDAGAQAIYLEEPEFWARTGYEPSFKREWKAYYGDDWQPLYSSPDAQYRASKLKYFLYRRALSQVFEFVKGYSKQIGRDVKCYVPTHSLINYANWRVVSPQSSLLDVGCDGYIAQVWTGTARSPNSYEGVLKERTFETAFLEYGVMQNLVRVSGRRMWFLNDPVEDNPDHSWDDYRTNWESTLTASLLQPDIWRYETMPWPTRIFARDYPVKERANRKEGQPVEKAPIPKAYETELQAVIRAMGDMKQPAREVEWQQSGTKGIGVMVSDTMMFQRSDPTPSDAHLGSFYGLALPLLKRGVPVEPVQIENVTAAKYLSPYRVLVLTYEGQKPPTARFHQVLAEWVRAGGALVVLDDDSDPYNAVKDWWNQAPNAFANPRTHLFQTLGLSPATTGLTRVGKGFVMRQSVSPAAMSRAADGGQQVRASVIRAAGAVGLDWRETNAFVLRRGPYLVAAGIDESVPGAPIKTLRGRFVDLFDANLPVQTEVRLDPGKRALLVDLDRFSARRAKIVAAACRVREENVKGRTLRFRATGIGDTQAVMRLILPSAPRSVTINGQPLPASAYDFDGQTLRLHFPNSTEEVQGEVAW